MGATISESRGRGSFFQLPSYVSENDLAADFVTTDPASARYPNGLARKIASEIQQSQISKDSPVDS